MRLRNRLAVGLIACFVAIPGGAIAHDTNLTALHVEYVGQIDLSVGLCYPVSLPSCVGPSSSKWRLDAPVGLTVPMCRVSGVFEGFTLTGTADNCEIKHYGTVRGVIPGTPPACGNLAGSTDSTSPPAGWTVTNTLKIGNVTRSFRISFPGTVGGSVVIEGELDDNDGDTNPLGDHRIAGYVQARPISSPGSNACLDQPAVNFLAVGNYFIT